MHRGGGGVSRESQRSAIILRYNIDTGALEASSGYDRMDRSSESALLLEVFD